MITWTTSLNWGSEFKLQYLIFQYDLFKFLVDDHNTKCIGRSRNTNSFNCKKLMNCHLDGIMNIIIYSSVPRKKAILLLYIVYSQKQTEMFFCVRKNWFFSRFASYKAVDGVTWRQPLQIWQYWLLLVGFQILAAMATFQILTAIGWFSYTDNCYAWFSIKIIKSSKWSAPGFHIFFCKSTLQESWR